MFKLCARLCLLAFVAGAIASCNTTAGVGKDIQKTGQGIQKVADKANPSR